MTTRSGKRTLGIDAGWAAAISSLVLAGGLLPAAGASAAVWSDQQDYAPGSVVTIAGDNSDGAGYVAGGLVVVQVAGPHGWASSCESIVGEGDGLNSWSCSVTLPEDPDVAVGAYNYTATSLDAGGATITESGVFTDSQDVTDIKLGAAHDQDGVSVLGGSSVEARIEVTTYAGGVYPTTAWQSTRWKFFDADNFYGWGNSIGLIGTACDNDANLSVPGTSHDDHLIDTTGWKSGTILVLASPYSMDDCSGLSGDIFGDGATEHRTITILEPDSCVDFQSAADGRNSGLGDESTLVVPAPSGVADGDVLVAGITVGDSGTAVTAPEGWQLIRADGLNYSGYSVRLVSFHRVVTAASEEPAQYAFDLSTPDRAVGGILRYSGVETTNPIDTHDGARRVTLNQIVWAPSVTTTAENETVVALFALGHNRTADSYSSSYPGLFERVDQRNLSSTGPSLAAADFVPMTAGATGEKSSRWNATSYAAQAGQQIALRCRTIEPPVVEPVLSGSLGANGWYTDDVQVSWSVTDGASVTGCDPVTVTTDTTGTAFSCSATNSGGTTTESVTIKRDATAPAVTWSAAVPEDGATYSFGNLPALAPTCTASDDTSGIDPRGCEVTGYSTATGTHTVTASATDSAGNAQAESRSYTVNPWTITGFYPPVDMDGIWNVVKGGATVPLKFEVLSGTAELTGTSAISAFLQQEVPCETGSPLQDPIEFTTTGGTSLRYDSETGQFVQNWQTPKRPGTCWTVTAASADQSRLVALFKIR